MTYLSWNCSFVPCDLLGVFILHFYVENNASKFTKVTKSLCDAPFAFKELNVLSDLKINIMLLQPDVPW